nr:cell division protein FtsA [Rhizobiaceae bacterium]
MRLPGKGLAGGARASGKPTTISVLDIGSTKVVCMIAKLSPTADSVFLHGRTHRAEVIGVGHQRSFGVKSGLIIDLDAAEQSIRMAVDAAERMAGMTVDSLIISATPGRLKSQIFKATIELGGEEVSQRDVERVLRAGFAQAMKAERQVVHVLPVSHTLDGERGVRDPKGLVGDQLGVTMHALTADAAPLRNIELCVN